MQIEAAGRSQRMRPDHGKLRPDSRLGVFCQRDLVPHHLQNRRLAPAESVAEIEVERPVLAELRMRRGFDRGAGLGLAMDARREPVGALPFERAMDRHRAVDAIAAAIQRERPRTVPHSPRRHNWR